MNTNFIPSFISPYEYLQKIKYKIKYGIILNDEYVYKNRKNMIFIHFFTVPVTHKCINFYVGTVYCINKRIYILADLYFHHDNLHLYIIENDEYKYCLTLEEFDYDLNIISKLINDIS